MKIEFDYKLIGRGLALGKLNARDFSVEFYASQIYDSLNYIVNGIINLLTDRDRIVIPFFNEPGEHQLIIKIIDNLKVEIELRWFEDDVTAFFPFDSTSGYETIFKGETTIKSFILNAFDSITRILDENGIEGYKDKWGRDFPIEDYNQLKRLIKSNEARL